MTKHVLDRARTTGDSRTRSYLEAERREGLHPATKALIRRERPASASKTRAFLTIARKGEGRG
jgi:hypothetical protein